MKKLTYLLLLSLVCAVYTSCNNSQPASETKDIVDVIFSRKSVRAYLDKGVEKEKIDLMLKAAMAAPSGKDTRPWEFVVVDDRATLDSMAAGLPFAKMLTKSRYAIVVCGDSTKSFYWYLDCATAAQNILLTAEAQGLGAVWTAAYPYEDRMEVVKKYLRLPNNILPLCVIPFGYPAMEHHPKDKYDPSRIHHNQY